MLMELNGYDKVVILINQANLHFNKYEDQWKAYDINNPLQALFYDFGEDGKMDFMILSEERKTINNLTTISYTRTSIINNLQSDTLHLKILPLSISSIYNENEKKIENTFGVTTQWLFTDIDGHKLVKVSNQKVQFNYGTFQLPYAYSGLGRTNNYLE
jgi:integrin alpha FG-GAP repeat containing protein 1